MYTNKVESTDEKRKKMLTIEQLKAIPPRTIFAKGTGLIPRIHRETRIAWIAVRGGIHDWCIYCGREEQSIDWIRDYGDKCFTEEVIKELVPCTDESFKMYRH